MSDDKDAAAIPEAIPKANRPSEVIWSGKGYAILRLSRSKNFYIVAYEKNKERLYETLGTSSLAEAKSMAAQKYRDWVRANAISDTENLRKSQPKILEDHWANYISLQKAKIVTGDIDQVTVTRAENAWARVEYWWGGLFPSDMTQQQFVRFAADFESRYPDCSLQNEHKYIAALANFCHHNGFMQKKSKIELGKEKSKARGERRKLNSKELRRLLDAVEKIKASDAARLRMSVLIGCGVYHGMRISEVAKIRTANIGERQGAWFLKIQDTKTDKDRIIKLNDLLINSFKEAVEMSAGIWLFANRKRAQTHIPTQTLDTDWHRVFAKADVLDAVFHELRHTAISSAVQKHELAKVSVYYGVSIKTLMKHYVHLDEFDTQELADAVEVAK